MSNQIHSFENAVQVLADSLDEFPAEGPELDRVYEALVFLTANHHEAGIIEVLAMVFDRFGGGQVYEFERRLYALIDAPDDHDPIDEPTASFLLDIAEKTTPLVALEIASIAIAQEQCKERAEDMAYHADSRIKQQRARERGLPDPATEPK